MTTWRCWPRTGSLLLLLPAAASGELPAASVLDCMPPQGVEMAVLNWKMHFSISVDMLFFFIILKFRRETISKLH
ncbi:MAG TPA: hypothetical protein VNZ60_08375 [Collimonas sp.]|nr:hypothetical protein [Collimonas sp.]